MARRLGTIGVIAAHCVTGALGGAYGLWSLNDNTTAPTSFFHSRPDINPPALDITVFDADSITPGYIFVAPWRRREDGPDRGAYIYDQSGNLVWSGAATYGGLHAHNPHVCEYRGADHLCFHQGAMHLGFGRGVGMILDSTYRVVKLVQAGGSVAGAGDMHEFRLCDGGRGALVSVYQVVPYDLSPFGITNGMGWVVESVFQEIDTETDAVVFEWRSLDHEQTSPRRGWRVLPGSNPVAGMGTHPVAPWDYFHINSIEKNADGDYLISSRHMSALYKISGKDGRIIWQLDGYDTEESVYSKDFNFSSQHDARWLHDNATHSTISLFDNASDNINKTARYSRGLVVSVDHAARTATLATEFVPPSPRPPNAQTGPMLSGSQGNLQVLASGNGLVGWGEYAYFSEHAPSGEAIMWAEIAGNGSGIMDYRAHKFNWTATPRDNPALYTYSRDGEVSNGGDSGGASTTTTTTSTVFYVSWNGATEVSSWAFWAGASAAGPWTKVGEAAKTGFETAWAWAGNFTPFAYAEALDADGKALRRSAVQGTFVPSRELRAGARCDEWRCAGLDLAPGVFELEAADKINATDVDWDRVAYHEGFEGTLRYLAMPASGVAEWAAAANGFWPQIALGMTVFLLVGLGLWLGPKLYRRWIKKEVDGDDDKAKGSYQKVENMDGSKEEHDG